MRILVVGGTQFVGRHLAEAALARGHQLTLLHRGRTGPGLFADAEHLIADRNVDLSVLADRHFDATIDSSAYFPGQVRRLVAALGVGAGHYVQVSSVSAYQEPAGPGGTESTPLHVLDVADPDALALTADTYGPLKAETERAAAGFSPASGDGVAVTIVRPTYVVGPYDHTGRFSWWLDRIARGGVAALPGPAEAPMQLVDARDLATWTLGLIEAGTTGALHACTPRPPWSLGDMVRGIAEMLQPADFDPLWLRPAHLSALEGTFPFWSGGTPNFVSALDPAAAFATGLAPRPFAETVRDTYDWMTRAQWRAEGVGVEPDVERRLIASADL